MSKQKTPLQRLLTFLFFFPLFMLLDTKDQIL